MKEDTENFLNLITYDMPPIFEGRRIEFSLCKRFLK